MDLHSDDACDSGSGGLRQEEQCGHSPAWNRVSNRLNQLLRAVRIKPWQQSRRKIIPGPMASLKTLAGNAKLTPDQTQAV